MSKNIVRTEGALDASVRKVLNDNFIDPNTCTTAFSQSSSTTLANVVGMVTDTLEVGTYRFYVNLATTAGASGGIKTAFKFGTASMLTSIVCSTTVKTASAVATSTVTTATDAASLAASTTAAVNVVMEGTLVVAAAGTLQLQAAQNVSDATATTIAVGSYMEFRKIA